MRKEMDLVTVIVPLGKGQDVLDLAKQKGVIGGYIGTGKGTANKELAEKYNITNLERDVVSIVAPTDLAEIILKLASEKFGIGKPNHGIAFSTNVSDVHNENHEDDENSDAKIKVITAIVKPGYCEQIIEKAREAGAKGGTILQHDSIGHGEELEIEEHKQEKVILIISKPETYKPIISAIREIDSNEDKKSIVYAQDAHFCYGLK